MLIISHTNAQPLVQRALTSGAHLYGLPLLHIHLFYFSMCFLTPTHPHAHTRAPLPRAHARTHACAHASARTSSSRNHEGVTQASRRSTADAAVRSPTTICAQRRVWEQCPLLSSLAYQTHASGAHAAYRATRAVRLVHRARFPSTAPSFLPSIMRVRNAHLRSCVCAMLTHDHACAH
jgi:hypothetical protein